MQIFSREFDIRLPPSAVLQPLAHEISSDDEVMEEDEEGDRYGHDITSLYTIHRKQLHCVGSGREEQGDKNENGNGRWERYRWCHQNWVNL